MGSLFRRSGKLIDSISVTPVETLDSGRQILPDQTNAAQAIATSFAWRDSNYSLIYPTSTADGIALSDMTLDGASKRVTSVGECVDQHPAFSAAAASVVFDSNCGGNFNLWRLDLASGLRSQLTSGSNFDQRPET